MWGRAHRSLAALAACAFAACGEAQPAATGSRCLTWRRDIEPLVRERCGACHEGPDARAGYHVDTYLEAIGAPVGSFATPDGSRLLAALGDAAHQPVADTEPALSRWLGE